MQKVQVPIEVASLIAAAAAKGSSLDLDVFAVSDKSLHNEYIGDDGEPSISYDSESWMPVKTVFVDSEDDGIPVLLIVHEGPYVEEEVGRS